MEQDHEVLDWGNEEEEHHQEPLRTPSFVEDADDAVSLGDEEDDNTFYSHQGQENGNSSRPSSVKVAKSDPTDSFESDHFQDLDVDESSQGFSQEEPQTSSATQGDGPAQNNSSKRAQNLLLPRLTHALPPKPVAASLPYLPPSHPSIVEATAMSTRTREYKRSSGSADKPPSHQIDQLPPNWEIRHPRSGGRAAYYYNTVTHQSTWQHPGLPTSSNRTKSAGTASKPPLTDSYVPQPLSYEDRHYRPGELPDPRRDDRASDEPELRRPATPPTRSPPSRERLRSRSRSRSPPAPSREISAENQETNRSSRSNHADLKGDSTHQSRNHSSHVSETSAPRHTASKSQNESSGHLNRETYNQQVVPANLTELPPPINEDRSFLSKSNSVREHNRPRLERDLPHDAIEGRQGPNHSLSLSSSRPRSPSAPYDREWIPARRETEPEQNPSLSSETTSRSATALRRERPSRFDQPSTAPQTPPAITIVEQTAPRPVYIPADLQTSHGLSPPKSNSTRPREQSPMETSRLLHAGDNRSPLTENGPNRQVFPVDTERPLPTSDQSGLPSRRKRAPLPPQAASFREETSRRRDHDPPRSGAMRPGTVPFPTLSQEYHSDAHSTGTSSHGTPQSVPHSRVEPHVGHRRRVSSNDGQYESGNARRGNLNIDNEHSARGYPQTRAHPSIDPPMNIDVDRMPSSSSRVPSDFPERAQDGDTPHRPTKEISSRSSGAGVTPSTEASISYPPGGSRKEALRHDILEQQSPPGRLDHPPRNERAFHERPDRHGPRRESSGRSNEHKAASSGSVPKLTGPNSVPIGTRRHISLSSDLSPPVPDYASMPKFTAELPPRPPSIAPGKELYDRPNYDARTSVDNCAADPHGYAEPGQLRQNISPSSYKRDHQSEPIDPVLREGRLDNQARERFRFAQPAREDRVPPTHGNESQSRTRSSSGELSMRNRPPAQWPPPEARIPAQLPPEFPPGKSLPTRISEEDRYYRPGRQDHYRERTEDYMPSPVDDLASRSRRPSIHSASFDGPYGGRTTEHPPPLPSSPDRGDRNHYPISRQQRPPERARPAEIFTPNVATVSSERQTRRNDQSFLVPDSPDHRAIRRSDRYEPDYGDGYSGAPSRRHPRPAKEESQRTESNHWGDVPYIPGPHHDQEFSRPSGRPLLDRLSLDTVHPPMNVPTVRDRATIPEKRDRNAVDHDYSMDIPCEEAVMGSEAGEPVAKKVRRRGHKQRRGRRGNGAS